MSKNTITVYWAPAAFTDENESWNMLYSEPISINKKINNNSLLDSRLKQCPAIKNNNKNLFALTSSIKENFEVNTEMAKNIIATQDPNFNIPVEGNVKLGIRTVRKEQYKNHLNYLYNLSWLFFADEPLEVKFSSPYMPPSSPMKDAFVVPGQFDIGQWYRPFHLEYMAPESSSSFNIEEEQELVYLQFLTDKKVVFKRYTMSSKLLSIATESAQSPASYGRFKTLKQRYLMASKSKVPKIVLSEIKKNLVED